MILYIVPGEQILGPNSLGSHSFFFFSVGRTFGKTFVRERVYVSLVIHVRAAVYPRVTPHKEGQGNGS